VSRKSLDTGGKILNIERQSNFCVTLYIQEFFNMESSLERAPALTLYKSVTIAGKCGEGFYINFNYEQGSPKTFHSWYQWRKLHFCRKYSKAGRPMEGEADVNEDFLYFSRKSQSSPFFKSSVILTPRFVEQVYRFTAVIPRIRQVTLRIATESYNSERF
jgi:hypothetical protein